jgi:hypothetical protein
MSDDISKYVIYQSDNGHVTQDHHGIGVETYRTIGGLHSWSDIAVDVAKAFADSRTALSTAQAELAAGAVIIEAQAETLEKLTRERDAMQSANTELAERLAREVESHAGTKELRECEARIAKGVWRDHEQQFRQQQEALAARDAQLADEQQKRIALLKEHDGLREEYESCRPHSAAVMREKDAELAALRERCERLEWMRKTAANYVRCSLSPVLTPYIKANGLTGESSPWGEFCDALTSLEAKDA